MMVKSQFISAYDIFFWGGGGQRFPGKVSAVYVGLGAEWSQEWSYTFGDNFGHVAIEDDAIGLF